MSAISFLHRLRRVFDAARILAFVLLLVYLPAFSIIALIVLFTSRGPAFVNRVYRRANGGTVDVWEFRTECWQFWRTTQIGGYLRRSNAYRLPSLINVIRGEIQFGERISPVSEHSN